MRFGSLYAKRTKLGPTIGRRCDDWGARDGWVIYYYRGRRSAERWNFWRFHADRVLHVRPERVSS